MKKSKAFIFVALAIVASLLLAGLAFAGTKTAGPWLSDVYVTWDKVSYYVAWSYNYKADYTDSGTYRTINNHYSGGCKDREPFPYSLGNSLHYFKNGTKVKAVYFDTLLSAMCSYPKDPYLKAKYNDPVIYSITGDTLKVNLITAYSSSVTSPSYHAEDVWISW